MALKRLAGCLAMALILAQSAPAADKFDPADYKEADYKNLRANAEDYKNKRLCFEISFSGLSSDFSAFLERMGFKDDKYFRIHSPGSGSLPIFARKTDELKSSLPAIKNRSTVKIYGKIRKFTMQPASHEAAFPNYYVEMDGIEVVKGPPAFAPLTAEEIKEVQARRQQRKAAAQEASDINDNVPKPPKAVDSPFK